MITIFQHLFSVSVWHSVCCFQVTASQTPLLISFLTTSVLAADGIFLQQLKLQKTYWCSQASGFAITEAGIIVGRVQDECYNHLYPGILFAQKNMSCICFKWWLSPLRSRGTSLHP